MWLLSSGIKIPAAAATPEALGTAATLGTHIWVGAMFNPVTLAENTTSVFVGNAAGQYRPLLSANWEGLWLPTGDLSKVFIKQLADGDGIDGVNWELWGGA